MGGAAADAAAAAGDDDHLAGKTTLAETPSDSGLIGRRLAHLASPACRAPIFCAALACFLPSLSREIWRSANKDHVGSCSALLFLSLPRFGYPSDYRPIRLTNVPIGNGNAVQRLAKTSMPPPVGRWGEREQGILQVATALDGKAATEHHHGRRCFGRPACRKARFTTISATSRTCSSRVSLGVFEAYTLEMEKVVAGSKKPAPWP